MERVGRHVGPGAQPAGDARGSPGRRARGRPARRRPGRRAARRPGRLPAEEQGEGGGDDGGARAALRRPAREEHRCLRWCDRGAAAVGSIGGSRSGAMRPPRSSTATVGDRRHPRQGGRSGLATVAATLGWVADLAAGGSASRRRLLRPRQDGDREGVDGGLQPAAAPGRDAEPPAHAQGGVGSARLPDVGRVAREAREAARVGARAHQGLGPGGDQRDRARRARRRDRADRLRRGARPHPRPTSGGGTACSSCRRHPRRWWRRSPSCSASTRPSPPAPSSTSTVATRGAPSATCTPRRRWSRCRRPPRSTASTSSTPGPTPTRPPTSRCWRPWATRWP